MTGADRQGKPVYAKTAISTAAYSIDHPYDYRIPAELEGRVLPGTRVIVPFGRGDRRTEAMVLSLSESTAFNAVKDVIRVLDEEPVLSREMINLILRIREMCFCTFYDVLKAVLPAGLWYHLEQKVRLAEGINIESFASELSGKERTVLEALAKPMSLQELEETLGFDPSVQIKILADKKIIERETAAIRGVGDKTIRIASLAVSGDEAAEYIEKNRTRAPALAGIVEFLLSAGEAAEGEIAYFTGAGGSAIQRLVKKGIIAVEHREVMRRPGMPSDTALNEPVSLNAAQKSAVEGLTALADSGTSQAALLFGVTGSGKTQVYMAVIEHVLAAGRSAIVLVPEIALTPQLMRIFHARFGESVAIHHSALSVGQRLDEWKRIKRGEARLVLGTRSAIFAPLDNLGVIVIDEEQEHTYKSENIPRYHARDVARYRAYYNNALLIIGSATPSVESYYYSLTGRYHRFELSERFNREALPEVIIADMRKELMMANPSTISSALRDEISANLSRGEQTILFINRRGNSRRLVCGECGSVPECPNCSNAYTYHSANGRLMCHLCGSSAPTGKFCPECGGEYKFVGAGTQKCEEDLRKLFPGIGILRMDSDTTSARHSHEEILTRFREEKVPVLLGTQMVAKGLDFENVTLVGVIDADQSLYAEDYRAHERTFSLITQVVGRAGRGKKPGRAVLQTFTPGNPILAAAARQDYPGFYEEEIRLRERLGTPPFRELILVTVSGPDENGALRAALLAAALLREQVGSIGADIVVLGPTEAPIFKVSGRYRYRICLSLSDTRTACRIVSAAVKALRAKKEFRGYSVTADYKPNDI